VTPLDASLWAALLAGALRLATPLTIAALGELLVQRAGLVNLGIEGMMLCGCLAGVIGSAFGGWPVGLLLGAASGLALGALFAATVLRGRADVVVAGIGIGVLAAGGSDYVWDLWQRHRAQGVLVFAPNLTLPASGRLPTPLQVIVNQSVLTWAAAGGAVLLAAILRYGRPGPVLEAVGSEPEIARLRGIDVARWQAMTLLLGGALAGTAGAALTVGYVGSFTSGMTGGRGYIAIAVVILARGQPLGVVAASGGFGLLESAGLEMQGSASTALVALTGALPYLAILLALALAPRRSGIATVG
jgi:simple sugar transport system permease protein